MADFQGAIDGRLPYPDDAAAAAVIARGRRLSVADDLATLEEICRPPASVAVAPSRFMALFALWRQGFAHPLKPPLMECAEATIARRPIACARIVEIVRAVASYRGLHAALNIALAAADRDDEAGFAEVETLDEAIRAQWRAGAG